MVKLMEICLVLSALSSTCTSARYKFQRHKSSESSDSSDSDSDEGHAVYPSAGGHSAGGHNLYPSAGYRPVYIPVHGGYQPPYPLFGCNPPCHSTSYYPQEKPAYPSSGNGCNPPCNPPSEGQYPPSQQYPPVQYRRYRVRRDHVESPDWRAIWDTMDWLADEPESEGEEDVGEEDVGEETVEEYSDEGDELTRVSRTYYSCDDVLCNKRCKTRNKAPGGSCGPNRKCVCFQPMDMEYR